MCDMCEFAAAGDEPPPRVFTASGDAAIGKFAVGDALIEGAKILQAAASVNASDAASCRRDRPDRDPRLLVEISRA
jgi:hypothetical protein